MSPLWTGEDFFSLVVFVVSVGYISICVFYPAVLRLPDSDCQLNTIRYSFFGFLVNVLCNTLCSRWNRYRLIENCMIQSALFTILGSPFQLSEITNHIRRFTIHFRSELSREGVNTMR